MGEQHGWVVGDTAEPVAALLLCKEEFTMVVQGVSSVPLLGVPILVRGGCSLVELVTH